MMFQGDNGLQSQTDVAAMLARNISILYPPEPLDSESIKLIYKMAMLTLTCFKK